MRRMYARMQRNASPWAPRASGGSHTSSRTRGRGHTPVTRVPGRIGDCAGEAGNGGALSSRGVAALTRSRAATSKPTPTRSSNAIRPSSSSHANGELVNRKQKINLYSQTHSPEHMPSLRPRTSSAGAVRSSSPTRTPSSSSRTTPSSKPSATAASGPSSEVVNLPTPLPPSPVLFLCIIPFLRPCFCV